MKLPLHPIAVLAVFAALLFPLKASAQFTFASDNAGNYGGVGEPTFGTGGNGGMGLAAWSFTTGGNAGGFIGNPADGGISGMSSESFGLFANPTNSGNFIDANRNLSTAMQVGDTFSFDWGVNFDADGPGSKGFNLYVGGVEVINVSMASSEAITINGTNTGFTYGANVMTWSFYYSDPATLVITANDRDGSGSYSNNFTVSGGIDAFRWYAAQLNNSSFTDQRQPYYNNLLITNSGLYNVATAQTESRFLTGSGNLAKTGNGTLTISGATNNFTGTVGITNGAIRATASSALGSASAVAVQSGAALEYSGGITVNRNLTLNGTGISTGGALRNISGDNTHSGSVTLGSASRIASDAGTLTISGAVSGSNVGLTVGGSGNTVIQTAVGIGSGRLTKENAGTLTLTANNSFTGNTLISGGALRLGNGGTTGAVTGTITNNGTLIYNRSDNITQSGVISGTGALSKQGAGTLTLSSANTYSGTTTVSSGTVLADNSSSLGTSAGSTTVESGATLELSGGMTTAENITITGSGVGDGGAIRSLGDGENTLTGNITLGGNARINVDAPIGSATSLVNWGTDDFTVEPAATTLAYYSQTATTMTMNGSAVLGDTLGGYLPVADWSSVANFGLLLSVSGTNNSLPFSVALYDGDFNIANSYIGSIAGIGTNQTVAPLSLFSAGSGIMTNISGMQFTWDSSGAVNATFASIVSIPTSGLTVSGNVNAGTNVLTVGASAASSNGIAEGLRLTGVVSGSGGTYGGTATTLVKDGGGTVYLSGNNTFTGDVRVLDGILNILSGSSTNALGVGSDLFISSLGMLQVDGNVSVSSFQGAGEGDAGDVLFAGNSVLTVNGAGKSMTMAGTLDGDGGLRIAGNSSTLVTLTGNNTYNRATTITAGTLTVAGTGGNQALGSTSGVSIGSSGKLLLSTSNQVRDNAAITLSGGTIQRASGVSEVFGNLNLTTASTLDFGTGAAGTLAFGTYTPSSLLTIQNFDFGSTLIFKSNLSSTINNASFFSFQNGGISSYAWDSGTSTFTITAIPEPSTYLAALGLLGLMLVSQRRSLRRWIR
jgi:autotransporter-associated beta strand protein